MIGSIFLGTRLQFKCRALSLRLDFLPVESFSEKRVGSTAFNGGNWSVRLGVRTPDFHSGNTGSIPVQTTKK
jgi:hypothetical protein